MSLPMFTFIVALRHEEESQEIKASSVKFGEFFVEFRNAAGEIFSWVAGDEIAVITVRELQPGHLRPLP